MVERDKNEKSRKSLVIVVEGAGQERDLSTECRKAFSSLVKSFGVNRMPRFVCGGGRNQAFDKFKIFIEKGDDAILLIDSEEPIAAGMSPWSFLKNSDVNWNWLKPPKERDGDCHFMVQCMENWIVASVTSLMIGGKKIPLQAKPAETNNPETIAKEHVFSLLNSAYKAAGQSKYSKGDHSFGLLERIDVKKLCRVSPWARRFFEEVERRCR